MASKRIRIPKASDLVVSEIREKIFFERLPVGTRLPSESELMEQFGLGRVSVREALRILERDGLIDIRRGARGGVFVRHTDISQVSDALALLLRFRESTLGEAAEYRLLMEPPIAELAASNATDEQRAAFRKIADNVRHKDTAELHRITAEACGNSVFEMMIQALHNSHFGHHRYDVMSAGQPDGAQEHKRIALAIAEGDGQAASEAMREHIVNYREYLRAKSLETMWTMPNRVIR